MSIEHPYYPNEEEYTNAVENLTDEQKEQSNSREKESKKEVVDVLSSQGFEDEDARKTLIQWVERKEHEVRLANSNPSKAQIELAIETASMYNDAGYASNALEELEGIEYAATCENDGDDLYNRIKDEENKILGNFGKD